MGLRPIDSPDCRWRRGTRDIPGCLAAPSGRVGSNARMQTVRLVEIAEILGVSHQRTSKIVQMPAFPKPTGRQGQTRLWDRREVAAWAKVWRRKKSWR